MITVTLLSLLTLVNRPLTKKIIVLVAVIAVILVGVRMMSGKKAAPVAPPVTD